jgi:hypothetical protein
VQPHEQGAPRDILGLWTFLWQHCTTSLALAP